MQHPPLRPSHGHGIVGARPFLDESTFNAANPMTARESYSSPMTPKKEEDDDDDKLNWDEKDKWGKNPKISQDPSIFTSFDILGLFSERSPFYHFAEGNMKPKAIRERAKSLWGAVAIISALIATISLANLSSCLGLQPPVFRSDASFQMYALLNFFSGAFNIFSAVIITVAWAGLEMTPTKYTRDYFMKFYYVAALPGTFFVTGGVFLLLAYLLYIYETLNSVVFYMSTSLGCFVVLSSLVLQGVMHKFNMSKIKDLHEEVNGSSNKQESRQRH
jgi:hypothetical protein